MTTIEKHQAIKRICPLSYETIRGQLPVFINSTIQYGPETIALVSVLNTIGAVSIDRIHDILHGACRLPISTGTIYNMVKKAVSSVAPSVEVIKEKVKALSLAHFDETGVRVDKGLRWAHVACNRDYAYISVEKKRGYDGMVASGILPWFRGIAVHDFWRPYERFDVNHVYCNAHLIRELRAIHENTGQEWALELKKLLVWAQHKKKAFIAAGKDRFSSYCCRYRIDKPFDELLASGLAQNPLPTGKEARGRPKKGKARNLLERFRDHKEEILLYARDFAIPFDNNEAERNIRNFKAKLKISGCFRTSEGASDYAKIMSFLITAKKNSINIFEAMSMALNGQILFLDGATE